MLPQYLPSTGRPYSRDPILRFGMGGHGGSRGGSLRTKLMRKLASKSALFYIGIFCLVIFLFMLMFSSSSSPDVEPKSANADEILTTQITREADRGGEKAQAEVAGEAAETKQQTATAQDDAKKTGTGTKMRPKKPQNNLGGLVQWNDIVVQDDPNEGETNRLRRHAVRDAFKHAYAGYEKFCFGEDELKPNSKSCSNWLNQGLTIVDSLDTMLIMGLGDEYKRGRDWIKENLRFDRDADVSLFETNIRVMGGMLTAFDFTGDEMWVDKAVDLGERLIAAFKLPSGIPDAMVNLKTGKSHMLGWTGGSALLAEIGTLQMEFSYLSHISKKPVYHEKALHIFETLAKDRPSSGLWPVNINPQTGTFSNNIISLGAFGDSFYEYLIKHYVLLDKKLAWVGELYYETANAIIEKLGQTTRPSGYVYPAEMGYDRISRKVDQLACFAGGMFALGAQHAPSKEMHDKHMEFARGFGEFCYQMYRHMPSGLGPQHVNANDEHDFDPPHETSNRFFALRPETVETMFYLYRFTNDTKYRDWGWEIFQSIEEHCKNDNGYAGIRDVTTKTTHQDDKQQSWFLAETLKYLYLLFSPHDYIPLDKYVFNTEAHPLHIYNPEK